jgi:flagellar biosynthesis protein FlhG
MAEDRKKQIQVLINSVERSEDAQEVFCQINSVVKRFLNREVDYLGHIERDAHVPQAVRSQMLVTHRFPNASASRSFRSLARRVAQQGNATHPVNGLVWEKLLNDWVN